MTDQLSPHAVQNAPLLRAIQAGEFFSPGELAEKAGVVGNNLSRKLGVLLDEGLIVRGESGATHDVTLTPAGERALLAISVYEGAAIPVAGGGLAIPFNLIDAWSGNPRTQFDPADDEDMARSIADKGVLQPIIVRPKGDRYEVVIGERRRRGAALAVRRGWQPADFCVPAEVRDLTDDEAVEIAGVENLQRENMHWMDEAKWYLRLANRLSGASIERLVGGQRKKRSIQDYIKCARELSQIDVARTYLPEGDKDQLTYVRARDLVGDKKEKPALELSPKLAVALLEILDAGLRADGRLSLPMQGHVVVTRFAKAPVGGPLATLSVDRKLTAFGFKDREVVSRTTLTPDLIAWLQQIGFDEDRETALAKVRAAVVGEMQAAALAHDGEYLTSELNLPKVAEASLTPSPALGEQALMDDWRGGAVPQDADLDDDDIEALADRFEQRAASGEFDDTPGQPAPPAPAPAKPDLPPMLAMVVIEAAHKVWRQGIERGAGTWGAPVLASFYTDARGSQLVQGHRMLAFMPMGETQLVCLANAGKDWIGEHLAAETRTDGRNMVTDTLLAEAQARMGFNPVNGGPYSTFWLNPPAKADGAAAQDPAAPPTYDGGPQAPAGQPGDAAEGDHPQPEAPSAALSLPQGEMSPSDSEGLAASGHPRRDQFADDVIRVAREARAFAALAAAARTAATLLASLKGRTKAPKPADVDPTIALLEAALDAAAPHLTEQG